MGRVVSPLRHAVVFIAALLLPDAVRAHAMAERYDLPLPLWLYLGAVGAAVFVSFLLAAAFMRGTAASFTERRFSLPTKLRWLVALLRIVAVAIFFLLLAAGFLGNQDDWDTNIVPAAIWVVGWVGLAFISAMFGDVWALLNPWTAIARLVATHRPVGRKPPDWVGVWPACLLFLAIAWAEIVWTSNAVPARLAAALLLYSVITWIGMAAWGIEEWRRRGEALSLFFGLFARFAPFAQAGKGAILLRPYGTGLLSPPASPSMMVFVILVLAAVGFDGISETPFWHGIADGAMTALYDLGLLTRLGNVAAASLVKTLGLLATPPIFLAVYLAVAALIAQITRRATLDIARAFVWSLVPIAIAYHLAHYFSYLFIQGQAILPLLSDPFGWGWDWFGPRGHVPDPEILSARGIWIVAVTAILLGHVAAVFLGHATALRFYGERRMALLSQMPMIALMVAYTILSLWILAQPIVAV